MSRQFVRFESHETGQLVQREVPIVWVDGVAFFAKTTLSRVFDLQADEGLSVCSLKDTSFETGLDMFAVHVGFKHTIYGVLIEEAMPTLISDSDTDSEPEDDELELVEKDVVEINSDSEDEADGTHSAQCSNLYSVQEKAGESIEATQEVSPNTSSLEGFKWPPNCKLVNKTEGPPCKKCQVPMDVVTCQCRSVSVRIDLPNHEGHLLLFNHTGRHTCTPMEKKGKAVVSPQTELAIKKAFPVFGTMPKEKLKTAATLSAFEAFLGNPDMSVTDVFKVAREVQDSRAVNAAVKDIRAESQTRVPLKDPDAEVKEMKRVLDLKGYRVFLFDKAPLQYFMCPLDLQWSPAKIMLLMDRHLGKPPFLGCFASSDGGHSCVRGRVVEKIATVVPGIGLIKLATFALPNGERGVHEAQMWSAVDHALHVEYIIGCPIVVSSSM
ncbi:hypothetical protein CYMTET_11546 [Cymbomonas tetramitiformis]|uniref:Uncharacterized protein n=1 Tax=Cymbomonas tetramitiformis TaxID=36881 RepID=A0AAE0GM87_9CHLO|nr:hypothetical protein CYMTET_11546 [Cymbomonas tetramitiformis]